MIFGNKMESCDKIWWKLDIKIKITFSKKLKFYKIRIDQKFYI